MEQGQFQITLPDHELTKLADRIEEDYRGAITDHRSRMDRFQRYWRKYRNRLDPEDRDIPQTDSNFNVPLIQWQVLGKWASEMESLFGGDAKIIAEPVGPSDHRIVKKVGTYMTARVLRQIGISRSFAPFQFRRILFGRSFAYAPWEEEMYETDEGLQVWYEGSAFHPLEMDDFIVPGEEVQTLHDFSFVIRKNRVRPQDLLRGEKMGKYQGISKPETWKEIMRAAVENRQRDEDGDDIRREHDAAEGVERESPQSTTEGLTVHHWYGRWRPLRGSGAADLYDFDKREMDEQQIVVAYVPDIHKIVSVQRLVDLYPRARRKRPFVETSLVKDGTYWSMGLGEMLESIDDASTANYRLFDTAGQLTVGPVIMYRPSAGGVIEEFKYRPNMAIPTEDPASVRVVNVNFNPEYSLANAQQLHAMAERITGYTDQQAGRASDRPNAPRTARGQIALLERGDVRASLDTRGLSEDLSEIISHLWQLEQDFQTEDVFFRVTEEDANGLFDVRKGGAHMTPQEFGGRYDFKMKFAVTREEREAQAERVLSAYQLLVQNPLVMQSAQALWALAEKVWRALGFENFHDIVPAPPDAGTPKRPREEWSMMLQGEQVDVNPMDHDDLHLREHIKDLEDYRTAERPDEGARNMMLDHVAEHQKQKRHKQMMQMLLNQLVQQLKTNTPETGGIQAGGPVPIGVQDVANVGQALMEPAPEAAGGAVPGGAS